MDRALSFKHACRRERGAMFLMMVFLIFGLSLVLLVRSLNQQSERFQRDAVESAAQFKTIEEALATFVAGNKRLPCPADGSLAPGDINRGQEYRDSASVPSGLCFPGSGAADDQRSGIVPWVTLGLDESKVLTPAGMYISYRVFSAPNGLTLDSGADMTHCDTNNAPNPDATLAANGQCESANHNNTDQQYLAGKGLNVTSESGTSLSSVAYVLINHGTNQAGAYSSSGLRVSLPSNVQTNELANTTGITGGTFKAVANVTNVAPDDAAYFDDRVHYKLIKDVVLEAGLAARDWPDVAPPVPGFTPTTTAALTTTGTDHFLTANQVIDQQEFQGATLGTETGVGFGNYVGGGGSFASCLWWPTPIALVTISPSNRKVLAVFVEASLNTVNAGGGFTVGFLPRNTTSGLFNVSNSTCGDFASRSRLGWQDGNMPSPRFAVEFDVNRDNARNDPSNNHVAIDFNGVDHGSLDVSRSASPCVDVADSYHVTASRNDCYTSPSTTWLMDGLDKFHKIRIEVEPQSPACSGNAPLLKAWVIPATICQSGTEIECTSIQDVSAQYNPASMPLGSISLSQCIPVPTPSNAFDSVYFGLTASSGGSTSSAFTIFFQKLKSGLIALP